MSNVSASEPIESKVTTDTAIECPVCKEFIELKLTVNVVISRTGPDDGWPHRVFIGLPDQESFSTHTCWPKDD